MDLPENIREQAVQDLAAAYLPLYEKYERFALVAKDIVRDGKPEVYRHLVNKENELSVYMDGFIEAAAVLGIERDTILSVLIQSGKGGEQA